MNAELFAKETERLYCQIDTQEETIRHRDVETKELIKEIQRLTNSLKEEHEKAFILQNMPSNFFRRTESIIKVTISFLLYVYLYLYPYLLFFIFVYIYQRG